MGLDSQRNDPPKDARILAQIALAQMAFGAEDHKKAMAEWLEGGDSSLANRFRAYMDGHPDEQLDVKDTEAMRSLLEKIRTRH